MKLDGRILSTCRGDEEILVERRPFGIEILSDIEVHGRGSPHRELKANGGEDTNAHRLEVIQAVRDGKHLELMVKRSRTYRQSKGSKNRRYLRFAADELDAIAPTFAGQPFLMDHNTYEQDARKGTILTSEAETNGTGMTSFFMGFQVVKPDAVISVLDGTIDRFSIGWFPGTEILCTVHGCNILGKDSCYCWPGEEVEVDGKLKIAEYEFKGATGKELSAVNVPAVTGTRIEDYRAALAAELHIPQKRIKERSPMAFTRLAAALGLTALADTDEDRAVTVAEGLRTSKLAAEQERDTARAALATATKERDEALAARDVGKVDALLTGAYRDGKLRYGRDEAGKAIPSAREARLRSIAKRDGVDALTAELAEMESVVPVGERGPLAQAREPERTGPALASVPSDQQLAATALQLGIPVDTIRARFGLAPLAAGGAR